MDSLEKAFCGGVSIWSIMCRRCKPCQVVLGEGGSSTYWERGDNADSQRHLDLFLDFFRISYQVRHTKKKDDPHNFLLDQVNYQYFWEEGRIGRG